MACSSRSAACVALLPVPLPRRWWFTETPGGATWRMCAFERRRLWKTAVRRTPGRPPPPGGYTLIQPALCRWTTIPADLHVAHWIIHRPGGPAVRALLSGCFFWWDGWAAAPGTHPPRCTEGPMPGRWQKGVCQPRRGGDQSRMSCERRRGTVACLMLVAFEPPELLSRQRKAKGRSEVVAGRLPSTFQRPARSSGPVISDGVGRIRRQ
ncbi:hypothetical protein H696_01008 [Fonticula alba]|uniref:Uncharacterized protein n=1 Tax=Fonticula alba TaxID=691883 RepID=A0A058ZGL1_FONAL|nr:hypothetical protein H696_01008 [Fonticula alba]KCV73469.1 hypothetical protein H696_01008 [Fonticula alba]|eukprot:XP_009493170.1 hypothetical protein H696_01008 [Fonticula alba]